MSHLIVLMTYNGVPDMHLFITFEAAHAYIKKKYIEWVTIAEPNAEDIPVTVNGLKEAVTALRPNQHLLVWEDDFHGNYAECTILQTWVEN